MESITVSPGDKLDPSVFAYYEDNTRENTRAGITGLAAIVASSLTAIPGVVTEGGLESTISDQLDGEAFLGGPAADVNSPAAFLNWIVFDEHHNLIDEKSGFKRVETNMAFNDPHQLSHQIHMEEAGFAFIYVSNETTDPNRIVHFDELSVLHTASPIVQSEDYYPFGLSFNQYQRVGNQRNRLRYSGKERQDYLGLNWDDFGSRMYMADLGRFNTIDPHADTYLSLNPYHYVGNDPMNFIDPTGMDSVSVHDLPITPFDPGNDVVILDEIVVTAMLDDCGDQCRNTKDELLATAPLIVPTTTVVNPIPPISGVSVLSRLSPILMIFTLSGDTRIEPPTVLAYMPPPQTLPGFPNAIPGKRKAGRKRWIDDNGDILEWDSQHGEVEVYDKTGKKHKGGYDPDTGDQVSDPVPGRTTPK